MSTRASGCPCRYCSAGCPARSGATPARLNRFSPQRLGVAARPRPPQRQDRGRQVQRGPEAERRVHHRVDPGHARVRRDAVLARSVGHCHCASWVRRSCTTGWRSRSSSSCSATSGTPSASPRHCRACGPAGYRGPGRRVTTRPGSPSKRQPIRKQPIQRQPIQKQPIREQPSEQLIQKGWRSGSYNRSTT